MQTFVKLYDWTIRTGLTLEERVVLSLIHQLSENSTGFWAGYKSMSDRLGIPKSKCKQIVKLLEDNGMVTESRGTILGKTRIIFKSNMELINKISRAHANI